MLLTKQKYLNSHLLYFGLQHMPHRPDKTALSLQLGFKNSWTHCRRWRWQQLLCHSWSRKRLHRPWNWQIVWSNKNPSLNFCVIFKEMTVALFSIKGSIYSQSRTVGQNRLTVQFWDLKQSDMDCQTFITVLNHLKPYHVICTLWDKKSPNWCWVLELAID